jgi:hypothetical protein
MYRGVMLMCTMVLLAASGLAQELSQVAKLAAQVDSTLRRINVQAPRPAGIASARNEVPAARPPADAPPTTTPAPAEPAVPLTVEQRLAVLEGMMNSSSTHEVAQILGELKKAVDDLRAKPAPPAEVFPSMKVGLLSQFHAQALQEQTSVQQDNDPAYSRHWQRQLFIRRLRVLVGGTLTKNTSFFFESDATNIGKVASNGSKANGVSMYVQDAQIQHTFMPELSFVAGLHLVGISRNSLQGATTLMGINYGSYQFITSTPLDNSVGRDLGLTARGFLADERLEYRWGLYSGRNVNQYSPLRSAMRLQYCFVDREKGFFYSGSTLGKGRMVNLGAGVDMQGTFRGYSADAFVDMPVGELGSITVSASAGTFDGGGTDQDSSAFTALVPRQSILFFEAGFLFRDVNLQPYLKYESQTVRATVLKQIGASVATLDYKNQLLSGDRFGFGVNYFINGHGASVKAMYEIVGRYRASAVAGVAERVTNGEASLQVQFYTY